MECIKFPVNVKFHKGGDMRYFSALDLVRIFERALRRTSLPLYFTKGFNPRVKMSFANTLKLGVEGEIEVTFYFTRQIPLDTLREELLPQLPEGLTIIDINQTPSSPA